MERLLPKAKMTQYIMLKHRTLAITSNIICFLFKCWHRRFNGKAGRAMLHFYLLEPLLRKESNMVEVTMRLVEDQALTRYRRDRNRFREKKVDQLWSQLEEQTIRTSAFLRAVSKLCAPGFPE
ncbi:hypothetical protein KP79_PYT22647 [Mizuhopecten yessoensis]|uniref:Uncharacterized protein n=1 Tax=Mizuhopecten yessoensis TaxID=6573 RepID=A0A210PN10_MIZYE|nr:hypothetical protein KP79_PYT22647 [Mizuhopecten yessoensis]